MIALTRLNHASVMLNCDLIETVEATPDTVIRLVNGQRLVVCEKPEEILQRIRRFRRSLLHAAPRRSSSGETESMPVIRS